MASTESGGRTPSSNKAWRTVKVARKALDGSKLKKTILTVDGGGLRGILPAYVLEELENAIKLVIKEQGLLPVDFASQPPEEQAAIQDAIQNLEFNVDLADYFDVMSGTSTGSIITTYIATKGKYCCEKAGDKSSKVTLLTKEEWAMLKQLYGDEFTEENCPAGSVRLGQATFLSKAQVIFPDEALMDPNKLLDEYRADIEAMGYGWLLTAMYLPLKMGMLKDVVNKALKAKYGATGVEKVLQGLLGKDTKLSDGLETNFIIPAFHLDMNRSLAFYYSARNKPATAPGGSSTKEQRYGYASVERHNIPSQLMQEMLGFNEKSYSASFLNQSGTDLYFVQNVDFKLWEIVRSSTAAPTYFTPSTVVPEPKDCTNRPKWRLTDGGVVANNPAMAAITMAGTFPDVNDVTDIAVLSIGCGTVVGNGLKLKESAGAVSWLTDGQMITVLMDRGQETSSSMMDHLVSRKYAADYKCEKHEGSGEDRFLRIQKTAISYEKKTVNPAMQQYLDANPQHLDLVTAKVPLKYMAGDTGDRLFDLNADKKKAMNFDKRLKKNPDEMVELQLPAASVMSCMDEYRMMPFLKQIAEGLATGNADPKAGYGELNVRTELKRFVETFVLPVSHDHDDDLTPAASKVKVPATPAISSDVLPKDQLATSKAKVPA